MIRRLHLLLAALLALAGATPATALAATPAEPAPGAQNCARASLSAAPEHARPDATRSPCTHPGSIVGSARIAAGCCVAAKGGDEGVSVFHGSVDDASRIRDGGLDPGRAPTWASRDRAAAEDAINPTVRGRAGRDPGIIESKIPRGVFDEMFAAAERGYRGFFPYRLRSSEIVMRSRKQIEAFNRHRVR